MFYKSIEEIPESDYLETLINEIIENEEDEESEE